MFKVNVTLLYQSSKNDISAQEFSLTIKKLMLNCTSIPSRSRYITPPILQLLSGVFHRLILRDITYMQHTTIETLLIQVTFRCSETENMNEEDIASVFSFDN